MSSKKKKKKEKEQEEEEDEEGEEGEPKRRDAEEKKRTENAGTGVPTFWQQSAEDIRAQAERMKKWEEERERQQNALNELHRRIVQHITRNDALSPRAKREANADTARLVAPADARWEPFLAIMGARRVSSEGEGDDGAPQSSEWVGVPRWKADAWRRQRGFFALGGRSDVQAGRSSPARGTDSEALAAHQALRATYFGIEYREWFALLLAVCPFPPAPAVLEWLVTQRPPLEWHQWSRAIERTAAGTGFSGECLATDDLDGEWQARCVRMVQGKLLNAPGWNLGAVYPRYLDERSRYDRATMLELCLATTTTAAPAAPAAPSTERKTARATGARGARRKRPEDRGATNPRCPTPEAKQKGYRALELQAAEGLGAKRVPCVCRVGDLVVVGKATGEAYVVDGHGVCAQLVDNGRESETIGTQLPPSFRVPRPFTPRYWLVAPVAAPFTMRDRYRVSDWLDTLQPRDFVCNFDADPAHYAESGDSGDSGGGGGGVVFRTMRETQAGETPWVDADDCDWWLVAEMRNEMEADGKSAENSRLQWATLEFPLGADPATGRARWVAVYVWQRGTEPVTRAACWEAVRDLENLLEAMPSGDVTTESRSVVRLRGPTPSEIVRLHEGDGA